MFELILQPIPHSRISGHCSAGILAGNLLCGHGLMPARMPALLLRRSCNDKVKTILCRLNSVAKFLMATPLETLLAATRNFARAN